VYRDLRLLRQDDVSVALFVVILAFFCYYICNCGILFAKAFKGKDL